MCALVVQYLARVLTPLKNRCFFKYACVCVCVCVCLCVCVRAHTQGTTYLHIIIMALQGVYATGSIYAYASFISRANNNK